MSGRPRLAFRLARARLPAAAIATSVVLNAAAAEPLDRWLPQERLPLSVAGVIVTPVVHTKLRLAKSGKRCRLQLHIFVDLSDVQWQFGRIVWAVAPIPNRHADGPASHSTSQLPAFRLRKAPSSGQRARRQTERELGRLLGEPPYARIELDRTSPPRRGKTTTPASALGPSPDHVFHIQVAPTRDRKSLRFVFIGTERARRSGRVQRLGRALASGLAPYQFLLVLPKAITDLQPRFGSARFAAGGLSLWIEASGSAPVGRRARKYVAAIVGERAKDC